MKKIVIISSIVIGLCIILSLIFLVIIPEGKNREVRQMKINDVNMSMVKDGVHKGQYAYGHYTYRAEVEVKNHRIVNIKVSHGRDSKFAKAAEGVTGNVIKHQTPNVDVVSGATTTSKAILKAIEIALKN